MDKTILVFSIISACAIGIGTGISLGAIQTGEMSGQINQMIQGVSNNFSPSVQTLNVTNNVASIMDKAKIGFGFKSILIDPDKTPNSTDEFFINTISSCVFHSDTSIPSNTCVVCTLQNGAKETLASGSMTLSNYAISSNISIPLNDLKNVGVNNVLDVKHVQVEVCEQNDSLQATDVETP
jgi:hypothetical protein